MADGLPLGAPLARPPGCERPPREVLEGRLVRLEPLDAGRHGRELYLISHHDDEARRLWTYLSQGPFASEAAFMDWAEEAGRSADPLFFAVVDAADRRAKGVLSLMRMVPEMGVIEAGNIWYAPELQRGPLPTEAMHLLFALVFDRLGYRRLEWKCNALNAPSRRAAERLGFTYEGLFRQHMVIKGRNRDTAWFALLDHEWPSRRQAFASWLDPANFDVAGHQLQRLQDFRA